MRKIDLTVLFFAAISSFGCMSGPREGEGDLTVANQTACGVSEIVTDNAEDGDRCVQLAPGGTTTMYGLRAEERSVRVKFVGGGWREYSVTVPSGDQADLVLSAFPGCDNVPVDTAK